MSPSWAKKAPSGWRMFRFSDALHGHTKIMKMKNNLQVYELYANLRSLYLNDNIACHPLFTIKRLLYGNEDLLAEVQMHGNYAIPPFQKIVFSLKCIYFPDLWVSISCYFCNSLSLMSSICSLPSSHFSVLACSVFLSSLLFSLIQVCVCVQWPDQQLHSTAGLVVRRHR